MTYFKKCPECDNRCYSASWRGSWQCPYCDRILDDVEAKSIAELEENNKNNNPENSMQNSSGKGQSKDGDGREGGIPSVEKD